MGLSKLEVISKFRDSLRVAVLTGYRGTGQVSDLSPSQDNHFPSGTTC